MREIRKAPQNAPASLDVHRRAGLVYADYRYKDELRGALVAEQRGLCCYCMGPITAAADKVKIEHWHSQSRYPSEQLSYSNLLAACQGGLGRPHHLQHCDTRKGNRDVKFNPADPRHAVEAQIFYALADGRIRSADAEFDTQLDNVLGLNLPKIMRQRKARITAIIRWHETYRDKHQRSAPRDVLERKRRQLTSDTQRTLPAYSPVDVWWLNQRLARKAR